MSSTSLHHAFNFPFIIHTKPTQINKKFPSQKAEKCFVVCAIISDDTFNIYELWLPMPLLPPPLHHLPDLLEQSRW
jgi:hypothetical protein